MFSKYDFLKDVSPAKEDWRIKVKVVRAWKVPNFQRNNFYDNVEMVLMDEQGGRIHATVKGSLQVWKKIHEGECYFIKKFGVGFNSDIFRPTRHQYHLSFNLRTDVKSIVDSNLSASGFDLFDYEIIEKESSDSPYLVDVIGLLSGIGEVCDRVVSGKKTKMVVLELDNMRGHKLECTLWEHYVDEVQSFLANSDTPHNIIIVQLERIKCFRGKVGLTNTKYTTRIIMDSKVPEIVEFKQCLSTDGVESSWRLTQLSTQSSYSFENDFLKETERKFISDVKLCSVVTTCIMYGTIKCIESKYNWWYKSCKKCPFSVCEDFEKWYCKNCLKHWANYYPRFSVQVRVVDNTDSASFLLFDRDCVSLLGMSPGELRELHFKRGSDLDQFPEELNVLNEKSMLFRINVKQKDLNTYSEPKYQVSKICNSDDIISAFIKSLIDPNDEANFDNAHENEIVSSEPEKAADVESQTCDSADVGDVSLTMLTPMINSHDSITEEFNFSAVRTAKKIKLEKELRYF
ncbi:uncharacterized protein LOC133299465 [Gastrolobium bilobum]|uniref:uncharacterized protein LOC133299465 n=1 Tax=Gastrolobium bilobum TaxID=150636 RepID=UPI002AB127F1|nr:uncharacterized protein LOC133299465 [Gastrolobium bilobum]